MFNKNKNCQAVLCDKFFYLSLPLLAPHQTVVHRHPCKRLRMQLLPFFQSAAASNFKDFHTYTTTYSVDGRKDGICTCAS